MGKPVEDTPEQKFKKEHRALLNRWNEWLDEPVFEFESDIDLEEE
jgi:chemotaxis regulatin CheY-phosphate phosphatase CheZ